MQANGKRFEVDLTSQSRQLFTHGPIFYKRGKTIDIQFPRGSGLKGDRGGEEGMSTRIPAVLVLNVLAWCALFAQEPPSANSEPTIRTTTREVILDVVVRDKHHHAIADLKPEEVQVYEDGVRQKINAFRDVQGAEELQSERRMATGGTQKPFSSPSRKSSTVLPELNFVSVVFAQIAPLNREFAREAVQAFLKSDDLPNTYVTIYRLSGALEVIQPYTSDKALLVNAVDRISKGLRGSSGLGLSAEIASGINAAIQTNAANIIAAPITSPSGAQGDQIVANAAANPMPGIAIDPLWAKNASAQDVSVTIGSALLTQAHMQNGLRFAENLSNGMNSLDTLRQLVQSQAKLPGRKVVLYLSDGLTLPMDRRDAIDSLIGFANRVDVSFYAVDTQGLSVEDPVMSSLATLQQAGAESSVNRVNPRMGHLEDDDRELIAVDDQQLALEELAESTGGFSVSNTNQIVAPMERVMEDIRTHYELAYTPLAKNYDGRFRKIEVKVTRAHARVQTRSGYFALPDVNGEPLQPFEMSALHAINSRPTPVEFPYTAELMKFRPRPDGVSYEMAFDIPLSSLKVHTNSKTGRSSVHVSVVALVHKNNGDVVGKVSRDLFREITKSERPFLKDEHIVYAEPLDLPPGHYWIDTAVTDQLSEKTTVKRMSIFVNSGKGFGVSSLELVRRVEPLSGPRNPQDPFETDVVKIMPTLAEQAPSGKPLAVYFVVYPAESSASQTTVTVRLFRDGKEVARRDLVPARQADGSMPMLLGLHPDPGQCDMIVTAQQGTLVAESALSLKIDAADSGAN